MGIVNDILKFRNIPKNICEGGISPIMAAKAAEMSTVDTNLKTFANLIRFLAMGSSQNKTFNDLLRFTYQYNYS